MLGYRIVGNPNYFLDGNLNIIKFIRTLPDAPETDDMVYISLYGLKERWLKKEWLKNLATYNLDMPTGYEECIFYIDFKEANKPTTKSADDKLMVIANPPIVHKEQPKFRMIPRFPKYFITYDGILLDTNKGIITEPKYDSDNYIRVIIHDQAGIYPFRSRLLLHRLVAMVWVNNDDYLTKTIVDHIDGKKWNCTASNLRWVTQQDNNNLKYEQNLSSDNYPVLVRNINTGEVTKHWTLTKACEYIGRSRINTVHTPLDKDKMWYGKNGKFEIKLENDPRDWYYINTVKNMRLAVNTFDIKVTIDGVTTNYKSWRDVKVNLLGLKPEATLIKEELIRLIKEQYPTAIVDFKERKGVVATDGENIYRASNTRDMSKLIPVSKSSIIKYMALGKGYGKWKFKVEDGNDNFDHIQNGELSTNAPRRIAVINRLTNVETIYNSLRETANAICCNRTRLISILENNGKGEFENYSIRYV